MKLPNAGLTVVAVLALCLFAPPVALGGDPLTALLVDSPLSRVAVAEMAPADDGNLIVTLSVYCPDPTTLYADIIDATTGHQIVSADYIPCRGFEMSLSGYPAYVRSIRLSEMAFVAGSQPTIWLVRSLEGKRWAGVLTVSVNDKTAFYSPLRSCDISGTSASARRPASCDN